MPGKVCPHCPAQALLKPLTSQLKSYSTFWHQVPWYFFISPKSAFHKGFPSQGSLYSLILTSFSLQTWLLSSFMLPDQNLCLRLPCFLPSDHLLLTVAALIPFLSIFLIYPAVPPGQPTLIGHQYWPLPSPWLPCLAKPIMLLVLSGKKISCFVSEMNLKDF